MDFIWIQLLVDNKFMPQKKILLFLFWDSYYKILNKTDLTIIQQFNFMLQVPYSMKHFLLSFVMIILTQSRAQVK